MTARISLIPGEARGHRPRLQFPLQRLPHRFKRSEHGLRCQRLPPHPDTRRIEYRVRDRCGCGFCRWFSHAAWRNELTGWTLTVGIDEKSIHVRDFLNVYGRI